VKSLIPQVASGIVEKISKEQQKIKKRRPKLVAAGIVIG